MSEARHKHADLIHAWADGVEIQVLTGDEWIDTPNPLWIDKNKYRVSPKDNPEPDPAYTGNPFNRHYNAPAVQIEVLKEYMMVMIALGDWHGVSDAANDLREIEAREWK